MEAMTTRSNFNPPTWEESNSVTLFSKIGELSNAEAKKRVRLNNKISDTIKNMGWSFREGTNVYERGYTLGFMKALELPVPSPGAHPRIHFEWYWDNCGGPNFWRGSLYTFFNPDPTYKFLGPSIFLEINDILDKNLIDLPKFEKRLRNAVISQTE